MPGVEVAAEGLEPALGDRRPHGGQRILGPSFSARGLGAVGDGRGQQGGGQGDAHYLISKMPSISTATPRGSDAAETAERA